ncbi:MAG: hypothetical protein EBY62_10690, partial [Cellvibrionales bacterium]|nr:hypothetical protein [Cellvibrionales bacterium]
MGARYPGRLGAPALQIAEFLPGTYSVIRSRPIHYILCFSGVQLPRLSRVPMRLKSIKLAGFKSFVDPTTVNFPSNMSAVVGPNGCGKSNIIDA